MHQPGDDVAELVVVDRSSKGELQHVPSDVEGWIVHPRRPFAGRHAQLEPASQLRRGVEAGTDMRAELLEREPRRVGELDDLARMPGHYRALEREYALVLGCQPVNGQAAVSSRRPAPDAATPGA